jgi:hypothetical protein
MKSVTRILAVAACLIAPAIAQAQKAEIPAPAGFNLGDTWEWRQVDNRTKVEEGKLTRTVVDDNGVLKFFNGRVRLQISRAFTGKALPKPWRVWPLEVGKKWTYEEDWRRADGVTGNTQQDAAVVGYEEVTVPAGKFMAFKIEYSGYYRNDRGGQGRQNDTYWYAPEAKADVKHIRDDGYNMYTRELSTYKRGAP